ncbi:MAG: CzcABC family efflux RND transporter, membrane fusion protein [Cytophagales bacterium]|jgi:cobalt-zinc-cadmium efflux system membrane fusion protein|nr:efflux RND transporter periplasmic adaptor subunit [Bacteroidota bacterium]MBS1979943.1 efflux RND transporter periplasmic adaptor subunit [Bacteroidota bacterium]WHZ07310.1 MAG: CzcABC family efflux RND transporter, membrane fusion protein [Cytophagales bacterium]
MKHLSIIFLLLLSCSVPKDSEEKKAGEHSSDLNDVSLTEEQFKAISIELGSLESRSLSGTIKANGMLDVPPQNLVSISAPLGGFVKSTELLQGMHVKKGQVIVVLEHPNYIQLQQDYLDSKSSLDYQEAEYQRQEELAKENVNALKALQLVKANYFSTKAKVEGLRAQLKLVNINPSEIENGEIKSSISIVSPISGFISQVNVNLGMHVNPTDVMFKIVDTDHVHAEAQVFEKDIPKLQIGQVVHVLLTNESKERLAKVYLIGKEITPERTVRVHCHFDGEDANLIPGTYFSATIETGSNQVDALPASAIVHFEAKDFIFIEKDAANHRYQLCEIEPAISDNGYMPITFKQPVGDIKNKIVVKGAYELLNALKNTEL